MTARAPSVVVYVNDGSYPQTADPRRPAPDGFSPVDVTARGGGMDPYQLHREFPGLWANYLQVAFAGPQISVRIAHAFGCDESTARAWLAGRGGCQGRHILHALRTDPETAQRMLVEGLAA